MAVAYRSPAENARLVKKGPLAMAKAYEACWATKQPFAGARTGLSRGRQVASELARSVANASADQISLRRNEYALGRAYAP